MKIAAGVLQIVAGISLATSGVLAVLVACKKSRKGKW